MRIVEIPRSDSNSIDVEFERDYVFDPRIIDTFRRGYKLSLYVNGRTLTVIRTDEDRGGWGDDDFLLRVYLPTEDIPDFTSTVYTYHGIRHEKAPEDTTEIIFHPSVTSIQFDAFIHCRSLVRVTIPNTVIHIQWRVFYGCDSLRFIRLPQNLEYIGVGAFCYCTSLEAVFLPPTVTHIGRHAFGSCPSLRFFNLPDTIDISVVCSSKNAIDY